MSWLNSALYEMKVNRVLNSVGAGTTDQDSSVLDMSGWDGVVYVALLGDVTSTCVLSLHAFENTASSTSSPTPSEVGTAGTGDFTADATSADNKVLMLDVRTLTKRYHFVRLKRGTANAVVDGVIAIQYRTRTNPVAQPAEVIKSALI